MTPLSAKAGGGFFYLLIFLVFVSETIGWYRALRPCQHRWMPAGAFLAKDTRREIFFLRGRMEISFCAADVMGPPNF